MKTSGLVIFVVVLFTALLPAQTNSNINLDDFMNVSVEQRRIFMRDLNVQQFPNAAGYFDAIKQGLKDCDVVVRRNAASKAAMTVIGLQQAARSRQSLPDVSELPTLQTMLSQTINDLDEQVRGSSVQALAYSTAPNAEIEIALLARLSTEANANLRGAILQALVFAGYETEGVTTAVISALDDKDYRTRQAAAQAVSTLKPAGALPKMANLLDDPDMIKGFVVEGMAAYGSEAAPYLARLEKMLTDGTAGGTLINDLRAGIEIIKNPTPQPSASPPIKALLLLNESSNPSLPPSTPTAATQKTPDPLKVTPVQQSRTVESHKPTSAEAKSFPWPWIIGAILVLAIAGGILLKLRRK
jgi:hypothetical protein